MLFVIIIGTYHKLKLMRTTFTHLGNVDHKSVGLSCLIQKLDSKILRMVTAFASLIDIFSLDTHVGYYDNIQANKQLYKYLPLITVNIVQLTVICFQFGAHYLFVFGLVLCGSCLA